MQHLLHFVVLVKYIFLFYTDCSNMWRTQIYFSFHSFSHQNNTTNSKFPQKYRYIKNKKFYLIIFLTFLLYLP